MSTLVMITFRPIEQVRKEGHPQILYRDMKKKLSMLLDKKIRIHYLIEEVLNHVSFLQLTIWWSLQCFVSQQLQKLKTQTTTQ